MKPRKPIPRISKKRSAALRLYSKLRKEYLGRVVWCEICEKERATEVHHRRKPKQTYLNVVETWLGLCRCCHQKVEVNKSWAREMGYLENI